MEERGATYPIGIGGGGYDSSGGIPYAILVGVDGKVIVSGGRGVNMSSEIEKEIKKIKFPGLKRLDLHKDAQKAAQNYESGKYDKAKELAEKELSGMEGKELDEDGKAAKADLEFIVSSVTKKADSMVAAAKTAENIKHYATAEELYNAIVDGFGKKSSYGEAATARLKEMRKDKQIKKEIKAELAYRKLKDQWEKKPVAKKKTAYENFIKQHKETQAAAEAQAAVDKMAEDK